MDFGTFKNRRGPLGGAAQRFVEKNFPVCPLCGGQDPEWTLKFSADLSDNRVNFRCGCCGSVLSVTIADLSGLSALSKNKNILVKAYTWQAEAVNAVNKTLKGKKVSKTYIRVESIGAVKWTDYQIAQEVPLEDICTAR